MFNSKTTQLNKDKEKIFDETMGSYDGILNVQDDQNIYI